LAYVLLRARFAQTQFVHACAFLLCTKPGCRVVCYQQLETMFAALPEKRAMPFVPFGDDDTKQLGVKTDWSK